MKANTIYFYFFKKQVIPPSLWQLMMIEYDLPPLNSLLCFLLSSLLVEFNSVSCAEICGAGCKSQLGVQYRDNVKIFLPDMLSRDE